jgi:sugar lactone lactonase YvrE
MTRPRPTPTRRIRPLLLAVAVAASAWPLSGRLVAAVGAEPAVITTIAGHGVGRGPLGQDAELSAPRTAAVDNDGLIWFTDTGHHQIKRLDPATGLVTVVAGSGLAGALGDGGPAVAAHLDMPHGVAVDNQGRLYIADSANNRIRMVTLATGLITTVAGTGRPGGGGDGGPASAADLDHPRFLVVAPDGSIIVADTGNFRIRRIDPGGVIHTVAGTGRRGSSGDGGPATAAELDDPRGLALGADGTLYVSSAEGVPQPSVRRIDPAGIITTIAGGRPAGYSGDGGPATAAALNSPRSIAVWGTDLYIADSDNSRIRHVDLRTGIIDSVVGTGAFGFGGDGGPPMQALVDQPRGVAVTPTGDLVIADTLNSRLRLVRFARPPVTAVVPPAPPPAAPATAEAPPPDDPTGEEAVPGDVTPDDIAPFSLPARPDRNGYRLVASDGGIFAFGDAAFFGSTGALTLARPIVGLAATPSGQGYRLVASDGGIFAFGDAGFFGSTGALTLARPIVGMAATPSGRGYWLVASDGGIFAFGDAGFFGSTGALHLAKPIVGMAPSRTGNGYWLVASDGGIFAFGDASFFGSTGNIGLAQPIVGMAATPSGRGYWLVASDGGIFAFGDAGFFVSPAGPRRGRGVVGMLASPSGQGYRLATGDGAVIAFGDATDAGSIRDGLRLPVVGIGG